MTGITSHVLDTSQGKPGVGIAITLERMDAPSSHWIDVGQGITNDDGRVGDLAADGVVAGDYRISFAVAEYFKSQQATAFYPSIRIEFTVLDPAQHYHVPLLLNPFGYSTYRGS
ncbi:5-hydroxyisourate hydrolase precursor [Rubripirellula obstinata]|uniref:5-hydroxyisourate hydrolase n=1 Tax=Rubripirellula obstinata TaxID=406547 RepID=A0A5B1CJA1_9BACT|nr:hydroxyisourate hydrolase [Rubripirellula obstinata]KAA1259533.1 5-hydroxyisourate hydrolase precursor [Rubripirellula obstinata]